MNLNSQTKYEKEDLECCEPTKLGDVSITPSPFLQSRAARKEYTDE
jgi:hypothetical protein